MRIVTINSSPDAAPRTAARPATTYPPASERRYRPAMARLRAMWTRRMTRPASARRAGRRFGASSGAERKLATIVFADLVGSTELASSLDPEELRRRLAPFFDVARSALAEHGGTVEKYIGDAVMAVFGVPAAHGDDPDRAVAAALALVERVERSTATACRSASASRPERCSPLEPGGDLSVTGEAVNAAARLQQAARQARSWSASEPRAPAARPASSRGRRSTPRDFRRRFAAWRAVGAGTGQRRGRRHRSSAATTTSICSSSSIGGPRASGCRSWSRSPARRGSARRASRRSWSIRLGAEDPRPEVAAGPQSAVRARDRILGARRDHPRCCRRGRRRLGRRRCTTAWRAGSRTLGAEDADEVAGALAAALGGGRERRRRRGRAARAWRRLVALLAAERPLIIGIDDAHWADDGFLDLDRGGRVSARGRAAAVVCARAVRSCSSVAPTSAGRRGT